MGVCLPTHFRRAHICCLANSALLSSLLQLPASGPTQPAVPSSVNEGSPSPPGPTSQGSLDTMLGLLQSDLSRRGVPTQAKGLCGSCNKPIAGQVSRNLQGRGLETHGSSFTESQPLRCSLLTHNSGKWVVWSFICYR